MACNTEETVINDISYICTQYPASTGMIYKFKLTKILGPAIAEILPLLSSKEKDQTKLISGLINKLFENSEPEDIVKIVIDMLTSGHVRRDSKRIDKSLFEQVFSGDDMMEAYKVFAFVLKTNYAGFFKGQKGKELLAKAEKLSI